MALDNQSIELLKRAAYFYEATKNMDLFITVCDSIFCHETMIRDAEKTGGATQHAAKESPFAIHFLAHQKAAKLLFKPGEKIGRPRVVAHISKCFDIGKNKVEEKDGFLNHWFKLKLIQRTPARGIYAAGPELFVNYPDNPQDIGIEVIDAVSKVEQRLKPELPL
jgi:hypothetical protein